VAMAVRICVNRDGVGVGIGVCTASSLPCGVIGIFGALVSLDADDEV
jgi:hypothetical protein